MLNIPVKLKNSPYNITIQKDIHDIEKTIKQLDLGNFSLIVTCKKVARLYKNNIAHAYKNISHKIVVLPNGEAAKSKENLFRIIDALVANDGAGKKIFLTAIGGGTVGDVAGFAAGIYKRGTKYIHIPTTLLAQIDSSIGGKTAIDLKAAKNILGVFHQPKAVIIALDFLNTLGLKEIKQGIAEAIKYAAINDKKFFTFLEEERKNILDLNQNDITHLIHTCAAIKAKITAQDEKETKGLRTILNFGHTLAHALESSMQYSKLSHGEAVAIGMTYAAMLSVKLNMCKAADANQLIELIKAYGLPTKIKSDYISTCKAMSYDKKFISGRARMVILNKIGRVAVVNGVNPKAIEETLKEFCKG